MPRRLGGGGTSEGGGKVEEVGLGDKAISLGDLGGQGKVDVEEGMGRDISEDR